MTRSSIAVVSFALLFSLAGCSGDDSGGSGFPDAGLALDQCLAATDMEIVLDSRQDASVYDPLHEAKLCALSTECYALALDDKEAEAYACIHDCLVGMPSGALSVGCWDCYAFEGRYCAANNCLIPCLGDDTSLCTACFDEMCRARLNACIGF